MSGWGLVWKNLFRKKLRTFLTIFAILVAFLIFGVLGAVQSALTTPPQGPSATRLVTTNMINFTQPLPLAYATRIRALENVDMASHWSWFGGYFQEPRNFMVAASVDPETYLDIYTEFTFGPGEKEAFLKDRTGIMVGKSIADTYGWKLGDRIPLKSNIWRQKDGSDTWQFTITGIFTTPEDAPGGDQQVFFHYDYFNESLAFGRDMIGQVVIRTKDVAKNDATAQEIDAMFQNSQAETETRTEAAFAQSFTGQLGDIGFLITMVVGAAFVTILLIAGNTMMLTVRERTGEIAVLKTIGFTARRIFGMILSESLLLAFIGGLIGLALAYGMVTMMGSSAAFFATVTMTPWLIGLSVALMALLGFLTGFLPAWRAMNTDIITAFARK